MTRPALAKRLGISPAYLGHLENDRPVRFSERIQERLQTIFGTKLMGFSEHQVKRHNQESLEYYRKVRIKYAKRVAARKAS